MRSSTKARVVFRDAEAQIMERLAPIAQRHTMTKHMMDRCAERGIGIFEVYAAIDAPEIMRPGAEDGDRVYIRGDVQVVVADDDTIKTVIDRFERGRSKPREPQTPAQIAARKPRSQAEDETWALAMHATPECRVMFVTPEFASKLLGLNTSNRPLRPKLVAEYAAIMRAGKWRGAGEQSRDHAHPQGVTLDWNLVLQDGQHRLTAMVETDTGVWMTAGVGFDPANYGAVDTGRNRKYADVLGKEKFSDANVLGSVAKMVYLYLNSKNSSMVSAYSSTKVSNDDVFAQVLENPDGFKAAIAAGIRVEKGAKGSTRTGVAAAYYLISRENDPVEVLKWFDGLANSDLLPLGPDPRKKFRDLMAGRDRKKRAVGAEHLALVLKIWEAHVGGRQIEHLSLRRTERMPAVATLAGREG